MTDERFVDTTDLREQASVAAEWQGPVVSAPHLVRRLGSQMLHLVDALEASRELYRLCSAERAEVERERAEALNFLRRVTRAYGEVIERLHDYDGEHPDLWAECSEHPGSPPPCGYRDLPDFFLHACVTTADVRDAEEFLKRVERSGRGRATSRLP